MPLGAVVGAAGTLARAFLKELCLLAGWLERGGPRLAALQKPSQMRRGAIRERAMREENRLV
jgi:hypothetical protein